MKRSTSILFSGGNPFDEADEGKEAAESPVMDINPDDVPV
jgi:hypothetical protein